MCVTFAFPPQKARPPALEDNSVSKAFGGVGGGKVHNLY